MTDARGSQSRDHAVVLGASMAGLLAARVLADFYRTVTIVERDVLPEVSSNRRGVPQGLQAHALIRRGSQILAELFPGVLDDLVADGVPVWDDGDLSKVHLVFGGYEICRSGRIVDPESAAVYNPAGRFSNTTCGGGCLISPTSGSSTAVRSVGRRQRPIGVE